MSDLTAVANNFSSDAVQYAKRESYYGLAGNQAGGGKAVEIPSPVGATGQFTTALTPKAQQNISVSGGGGAGAKTYIYTNTVSGLFPTNTTTFNGVLQFQMGFGSSTVGSGQWIYEPSDVDGDGVITNMPSMLFEITLEDTAGNVLGRTSLNANTWKAIFLGGNFPDDFSQWWWYPEGISGSMYVNATGSGTSINPDVRLKIQMIYGTVTGSTPVTSSYVAVGPDNNISFGLSGRIYPA
jgi:hypothetical protein